MEHIDKNIHMHTHFLFPYVPFFMQKMSIELLFTMITWWDVNKKTECVRIYFSRVYDLHTAFASVVI